MENNKFELVSKNGSEAICNFYNDLFTKSLAIKFLANIDTDVCIKEVVEKICEKDCKIFEKVTKAIKRLDIDIEYKYNIEFNGEIKLKEVLEYCENSIDSLNDTLDVLYNERDWVAAIMFANVAKKMYDQYHIARKLYKILSSDEDNIIKRLKVKELADVD